VILATIIKCAVRHARNQPLKDKCIIIMVSAATPILSALVVFAKMGFVNGTVLLIKTYLTKSIRPAVRTIINA